MSNTEESVPQSSEAEQPYILVTGIPDSFDCTVHGLPISVDLQAQMCFAGCQWLEARPNTVINLLAQKGYFVVETKLHEDNDGTVVWKLMKNEQ